VRLVIDHFLHNSRPFITFRLPEKYSRSILLALRQAAIQIHTDKHIVVYKAVIKVYSYEREVYFLCVQRSRYSNWLWTGWMRVRSSSSGRDKFLLLSTPCRPILGPTQPPIQWIPGPLSQGVKRPEREADHFPPTIAEIKNGEFIRQLHPHKSSWRSA
jgi:hypothetical protein